MEAAAKLGSEGTSLRQSARDYNINRNTLKRYIDRTASGASNLYGYKAITDRNKIFTEEIENDLASHVKDLSERFYGLSSIKCRQFAFELAQNNNIPVPDSWTSNKLEGKEWLFGFIKRHHLSLRTAEATSLVRATAFNKNSVKEFFDNLASIMDRFLLQPDRIYDLDETGVTTVQTPRHVLAEKGIKQVGSFTSAERGQLLTLICAISATGNSIPPLFIFPRVNFKDHFNRDGPIGAANKSGWTNENIFYEFLQHFASKTSCSKENPALLILDNHVSHVSLRSVEFAEESGLILLTLPPHTSHRLQPLDRTVFGLFKAHYDRVVDGWMRTNPGKTMTIYNIPALVNKVYLTSFVPSNILSGFKSTGIFPFDRDIFPEECFAPAETTDLFRAKLLLFFAVAFCLEKFVLIEKIGKIH